MKQAVAHDIDISLNPFEGKVSIKGKEWVLNTVDDARVETLVQAHGLPEIIARLMVMRELDGGDVEGFLNPTLAKNFPNPMALKNMNEASDFLVDAIQNNKTIGILSDFDVDGATSCALMTRFLNFTGQFDVPTFIPDRLGDGYGPSAKGFDDLKNKGVDVVVVLDCGITSVVPIAHAKSIGLDVVVVDHHEPDSELPNANFIIDPKLHDDNSGLDYLAAVGVTFLLAVAVNSKLKLAGFYNDKQEPDMREFLDLVALGTVCDMVPLVDANRLFVKQGFPMMAQGRNIGLNALLSVSKITAMPDPYHAGFMLGPRINAGSRVHQSNLGAALLSTADESEAMRIAWLLDDCNEKRKDMQKDMTRQAMEKAKAMMIERPDTQGLIIDGEGWHTGISGLVAGAIKDKYDKPACVVAYTENENGKIEGRASGRSIKGVHIADIFMDAQKEGLIVKGGGHAMAGGFTIFKDKLDDFRAFFNDRVEQVLRGSNAEIATADEIDLSLAVRSLNIGTAKLLIESIAPFGMGHAEPTTILSNVIIAHADQVGVNHLRCNVKDAEGSQSMKCMAFKALDSDLGKQLREIAGTNQQVHLKGQVKINEWQGRQSVEFHINDAMVF